MPLVGATGLLRRVAAFVVPLVLVLSSGVCRGAHVAPAGDDFFLVARRIPLKSVLMQFAKSNGLNAVVSGQLATAVYSGRIEGQSPDEVMAALGMQYGLAWYRDERRLYVYRKQELRTETLDLPTGQAGDTRAMLTRAGVLQRGSCELRGTDEDASLAVHGVPACLDRVRQLAESSGAGNGAVLPATSGPPRLAGSAQAEDVKIYPLKYAFAVDNSYDYRGQQVVVPGVVSALRELSSGRSFSPGKSGPATGLPLFSTDRRSNSVIVRALKSDIPVFDRLIAQLDRRSEQIEISVTIVDVNSGDLESLGIDWSAATSLGDNRLGLTAAADMTGGFSTVIRNTVGFMARLNLLAEHSKARILSRPSVVTLNNMQAVLDRSVSFYTKLVGTDVAELKSISTGALLRVTPRLIDENGEKEVLLTLDIEDGTDGPPIGGAERLPRVQKSQIETQAMLKVQQSLLLGGLVQDSQTEHFQKIPLLGDIPILGKLFQSRRKDNTNSVRMFVITARPITLLR